MGHRKAMRAATIDLTLLEAVRGAEFSPGGMIDVPTVATNEQLERYGSCVAKAASYDPIIHANSVSWGARKAACDFVLAREARQAGIKYLWSFPSFEPM